jgi:hypothetical protein
LTGLETGIDIHFIIEELRQKRPLFHSEADFQFAFAWEIQRLYPYAHIRLEYPPVHEPNKYIVILVRIKDHSYPIELKYKTKKLSVMSDGEPYHLKNHGAQDLGAYDFVKDICRVELFSDKLEGFKNGYIIWLTNDPYYWNAPINPSAGYAPFSVHNGAIKTGAMAWGSNLSAGTIRGREKGLLLQNEYKIEWNNYSDLAVCQGVFKYALIGVG